MAKKIPSKMTTDERYRAFANRYIVDFNGTKAAIDVGYAKRSASMQASRLLRNDKVQQFIKEALEQREKATQINAAWVLKQLVLHATADIRKLRDENGNILPPDKWPDDVALAVEGMDVNTLLGGEGDASIVTKLKLSNKLKALELLGKHTDVQAFKERIEHDVTDRMHEAIMAARKRSGK